MISITIGVICVVLFWLMIVLIVISAFLMSSRCVMKKPHDPELDSRGEDEEESDQRW